jgi:hypothetical protein
MAAGMFVCQQCSKFIMYSATSFLAGLQGPHRLRSTDSAAARHFSCGRNCPALGTPQVSRVSFVDPEAAESAAPVCCQFQLRGLSAVAGQSLQACRERSSSSFVRTDLR